MKSSSSNFRTLINSPTIRTLATPALVYFAFITVITALNFDLVLAPGWLDGIWIGLALAWVWSRSQIVRTSASFAACIGLLAMAMGWTPYRPEELRALCQAVSISMPLGLIGIALLNKPQTYAYLRKYATALQDQALLTWLDEHDNSIRSTPLPRE